MAISLFLCYLAISAAGAHDANGDDLLIGAHQLTKWKEWLRDEEGDDRGWAAIALGKTRAAAPCAHQDLAWLVRQRPAGGG